MDGRIVRHKSFWASVLSLLVISTALQGKAEAQCGSANAKVMSCVDRSWNIIVGNRRACFELVQHLRCDQLPPQLPIPVARNLRSTRWE
jgi:hypothetical protein